MSRQSAQEWLEILQYTTPGISTSYLVCHINMSYLQVDGGYEPLAIVHDLPRPTADYERHGIPEVPHNGMCE